MTPAIGLAILSLLKDARSSCRWFDKLTMSGLEKTLQSSWEAAGCNLRLTNPEPIMDFIVPERRGAGVDERARLEIA